MAEGGDKHSDFSVPTPRPRRMTEKGEIYVKEQRSRALRRSYRDLKQKQEYISPMLDEDIDTETLRQEYSHYLTMLEAHYILRDELVKLLSEEEREEYNARIETEENVAIEQFKKQVEDCFRDTSIRLQNKSASVAGGSKHGSQVSQVSSIVMERLKEDKRRVELLARASALKDTRKLEMEKLRIKMEEQELEIKTELAISEAKAKVMDEFERSLSGSDVSSKKHYADRMDYNLTDTRFKFPTSSQPQDDTIGNQEMNPHADSFVPQQRTQESSQLNIDHSAIVQYFRRPVTEMMKFSGDPLSYRRFMRQFHSKILMNTKDMDEIVNYLDQFTVGEANKIVTSYSYLSSDRAYQAILEDFEDRYGDSDMIACAFTKKALDWPAIRSDSAKGLDDFSIFLTECENAVQSIEAMRILEYPENIKRLVMKLPSAYHDRWRSVVQKVKNDRKSIQFHMFVDFVRRESKKANDPVFGKKAMAPESKFVTFRNPKTKSFATSVVDKSGSTSSIKKEELTQTSSLSAKALRPPCIRCGANEHGLELCSDFKSLSYDLKLRFLMSKGLCFKCLRCGHRSKDCTLKVKCSYCQGNHQTLLHVKYSPPVTSACASQPQDDTRAGETEAILSIIPVKVRLRDTCKVITTYAFMDPGSSVSFCSDSLVQKLGCEGKQMKITLETMGRPHSMSTQVIEGLEICNLDNVDYVQLPKVYSKDKMPVSQIHIPTQQDISRWIHFGDVHLHKIDSEIGLLIGSNVPDAYSPLEVRTGSSGSPHATKTRLGWIVWNVMRNNVSNGDIFSVNAVGTVAIEEVEKLRELDSLVQAAINLDFPERITDDKREKSQEDKRFMEIVDSSIKFEEGHYLIKLPFRRDNVSLPENQKQALQRLLYLRKKFERNLKFHKDYTEFMKNVFSRDFAERVPDDEVVKTDGKEWYIPHHGIYHPRKPDKIRVVFDCAATYNGVSLNKELLQGPDMTNNLIGVLLRFRQESVAFMSDIESMFYQVHVPVEDRDFLRFLWWPEGNFLKEPAIYRMRVHLFGAVSSPSCANAALRRTAQDNRDKYDQEVNAMIQNSFYVDDCLKSVPTSEKAIRLVSEVRQLCALGGFRLTKWISNSRDVVSCIAPEERAKGMQNLNLGEDQLPSERALGILWDVESDQFKFEMKPKEYPASKRGILAAVSSLFDPQGFIAPYALVGRILLQNLCTLKVDWDSELEETVHRKWNQWIADLAYLGNIELPRCYKPEKFDPVVKYELHMFSDASDSGYGVVAYLRLINNRSQIHCVLLFAKSRVAPLKRITVPRMELTAATLSVRLCKMLLRELEYPIATVFYWTDSMSVIRYIANEKTRFHTFVANRIEVIRDATNINQWRYIDTRSNPADIASRGMRLAKLLNTDLWWQGPDFLWKSEIEWPDQRSVDYTFHEDPEVKKVVCVTHVESSSIDKLLCYFSNWMKLKRSVGWMLLVFQELKTRSEKRRQLKEDLKNVEFRTEVKRESEIDQRLRSFVQKSKQSPKNLSQDVLCDAETVIFKCVQRNHFEIEITSCRVQFGLKSQKLQKLDPVLINGLLRVGGRLAQADIPFEAKHPVLLPKDSHVSKLIIEDEHKNVGHLGKNTILTKLREKYWILGASSIIKSVLSKCVVCRKYQARALDQKMSDLPLERVKQGEPPFTHVGVDFFGPLIVKRGRSSVKRYGVIFTCLAIRAVHLEVAFSLDTDSCINAIRRFIARRGSVQSIRSDNGTNLVGSERELSESLSQLNNSKICKELSMKGVSWVFNPPTGSHHGGVWERLIRSVRKVMYSILQEQVVYLNDEGLQTLFCEIESILNGRPITTLPDDPHDLSPLTPNHLLLMKGGEISPPGLFEKEDLYVKRRWRQIQYLSDLFWKRWIKEYLPLLQQRQKWTTPRKNVSVGDIVLLMDNSPRNSWSLGRVMQIFPDKKGYVRTVKVKTQTSELIRPIHKLCLISESDSTLP